MKDNLDTIVILAGGLATRLRPLTENIPKSLLDISGKPFISHQLDYIKSQKIKNVVICSGFLGNKIKNFIGDGLQYNLSIKYSFDGETLLGTGGALKKAINLLPNNFFVIYGDSFLPINFEEIKKFYFDNKIENLITIYKNNNRFDKSNIVFKDNRIVNYDKIKNFQDMQYIDYGLSILSKSSLQNYHNKKKFDLGDLFKSLSVENKLYGLEVFKRFYEIGSYEGIKETNKFLKNFKFED